MSRHGHVALDERGPTTHRRDLPRDRARAVGIVEIVHTDVGAGARERERRCPSDTLLRAGDESDLPIETHP